MIYVLLLDRFSKSNTFRKKVKHIGTWVMWQATCNPTLSRRCPLKALQVTSWKHFWRHFSERLIQDVSGRFIQDIPAISVWQVPRTPDWDILRLSGYSVPGPPDQVDPGMVNRIFRGCFEDIGGVRPWDLRGTKNCRLGK